MINYSDSQHEYLKQHRSKLTAVLSMQGCFGQCGVLHYILIPFVRCSFRVFDQQIQILQVHPVLLLPLPCQAQTCPCITCPCKQRWLVFFLLSFLAAVMHCRKHPRRTLVGVSWMGAALCTSPSPSLVSSFFPELYSPSASLCAILVIK